MTVRAPIVIPTALAPLAEEKRWVVWRWVPGKDGKPTKPPFCADEPNRHASSTDPSTRSDLRTAMFAYTEERCDGIGFVLTGTDIAAFDIDDCRNASTGTIHPWAQDLVCRSGSYAEVTPSGEGIRIIGRGNGEPVHRKISSVPNTNGVSCEFYRKANRYITITGNQIGDVAELLNIDVLFDETLADLDGKNSGATNGAGQGARREHDLDSLIKDDCGDDFGGDRSRAVWYVINQLLKQGRAADDIVTLLLNPRNGISAHIYDQSQPEEYARKQVEKAQQDRANTTNDDAEIERLARLPPLEYGRSRRDAATKLGLTSVEYLETAVKAKRKELGIDRNDGLQGQAVEYEEPEPWPEPVDVGALLDDIAKNAQRFVVLPKHGPEKIALWTAYSYVISAFDFATRLEICAALLECGKSTLLDFLGEVVYRPDIASNISTSAFFRVVDQCRPTLLIDEVDSFVNEDSDILNVLNSGHHIRGRVKRTVGENYDVRSFRTFALVAYAHIGELPRKFATLVRRSIQIELKRRLPEEEIESLSGPRRRNEFADLRRRLKRFANDHVAALANAEPAMPHDLVNRVADNWSPLLAIADLAGGEWPKRARDAISQSERESSEREMLLADIRHIYGCVSLKDGFISSTNLAKQLRRIEERPWAAYGRSGTPITTHKVSALLKPLKIRPQPDKAGNARGYYKSQFDDAFARYLEALSPPSGAPPLQSVRSVRNPDGMGTSELFQSVRKEDCPDTSKGAGNTDGASVSDTSDDCVGGTVGREAVVVSSAGHGAGLLQSEIEGLAHWYEEEGSRRRVGLELDQDALGRDLRRKLAEERGVLPEFIAAEFERVMQTVFAVRAPAGVEGQSDASARASEPLHDPLDERDVPLAPLPPARWVDQGHAGVGGVCGCGWKIGVHRYARGDEVRVMCQRCAGANVGLMEERTR